jgi:PAS domain S-box-containing protein
MPDLLIQNAPLLILRLDDEGHILTWNAYGEDVFGYPSDEVLGQELGVLFPPEDRDWVRGLLSRLLQSAGFEEYEKEGWHQAEYRFPIQMKGGSLESSSGQRAGFLFYIADVSKHRDTEKKLAFRRTLWFSLMENTPDLVYFKDTEHRIIQASQAYADIFDLQAEDLIGLTAYDLWPKEAEKIIADEKRILSGEAIFKKTRKVTTPSGETQWYLLTKIPIYENGEVVGFFAIDKNITDQKRAEWEIKERQLYLESVFNAAPGAIVTVDAEHHIVEWNPGAEKLFGYSRAEVIGKNLDDLITTEEVIEEAVRFTNQVITGQELAPVETVRYRKDGQPVNVVVAGSPIIIEGELVGVVGVYDDITSRVKAEAALQESREQYRQLSDATFEAILLLDDGICIGQNKSAERKFGYAFEEAVGQEITAWIHPDWQAQVVQHLEAGLEAPYEAVAVTKDGSLFPCELQGRQTVDGGKPISILALRDISERKRAEEMLFQEREIFRIIANAAIYTDSLPALCHQVLSGLTRTLNFDFSTFRIMDDRAQYLETTAVYGLQEEILRDKFKPQSLDNERNTAAHVARTREMIFAPRVEGHPISRSHPERLRELDIQSLISWPIMDVDQKVLGVMQLAAHEPKYIPEEKRDFFQVLSGMIATALKRRKAEEERDLMLEALRESEERFRSIYENSTIGMYRTNPEGEILLANPALVKMLGFASLEELQERNLEEKGFGSDYPRREFKEIIEREGKVTGYISHWKTKDDRQMYVRESAKAFKDPEGRVLYYEGTVEDITDRMQMQKQLERQERLAAVGQLASGIAHDFRNILSTMILYAQLSLQVPDTSDSVAKNLQIIVDEAQKAADLVQQILDFSRQSMIERQPMDLGSFLGEVLAVLGRTIPEHISLIYQAHPGRYPIKADEGRLQQVITNLTINARDAMPEGGELRFRVFQETFADEADVPVLDMPPGEYVCLDVTDTGTGMTPEVQAHLFEPFFTTKDVDKGTGLGLAQVYGIVRQHEGFIHVETEPGKGSTFRIYLPRHAEAQAQEQQVPRLKEGAGERVLLVEDQENLRSASVEMLETLGYRVLAAENGREALNICRETNQEEQARLDLVITDLVMPEMGGKQLIRELQELEPDFPVMAVTGYALKETDLSDLEDLGFAAVIRKPFKLEEIAQLIQSLLQDE